MPARGMRSSLQILKSHWRHPGSQSGNPHASQSKSHWRQSPPSSLWQWQSGHPLPEQATSPCFSFSGVTLGPWTLHAYTVGSSHWSDAVS